MKIKKLIISILSLIIINIIVCQTSIFAVCNTLSILRRLSTIEGIVWDDENGDGYKQNSEKIIPGIDVKLSNGWTTVTDAAGAYRFSSVTPGNYFVEFTYGNKHIKYNGHDYESTSSNARTSNATQIVPVEIFFVFDCSIKTEPVIGELKRNFSRLINFIYDEAVAKSADVKIGIIKVDSTVTTLTNLVSVRNNKTYLNNIVDNLQTGGAGNNILSGMEDAKNKFSSIDADKHIAVLSDYGNINSSAQSVLLDQLSEKYISVAVLRPLRPEGQMIVPTANISLIPFYDEAGNGTKFFEVEVKGYYRAMINPVSEYTSSIQANKSFATDDTNRRNVVINWCNSINNAKSKILNSPNAASSTETTNNQATLMREAFMKANSGGIVAREVGRVISNVNLGIRKRESFNIDIEEKVSAVKITLSNGKVFDNRANVIDASYVSDKNNFNFSGRYKTFFDNEILHGAKLEIEYEVIIHNKSSIPITKCKVIVYNDKFGEKSNLTTFDKNYKLITNSTLNNQNGFKEVNKSELLEYIDDSIKAKFNADNKDKYVVLDLSNINITGNTSISKKFVVSTVITSTMKLNFKSYVEILEYANNNGRYDYRSVPGNFDISISKNDPLYSDYSNYLKVSKLIEPDAYIATEVSILPPTGLSKKNISFLNYKSSNNSYFY